MSNQIDSKGLPEPKAKANQIDSSGLPAEREETKMVDKEMEKMC